MPRTLKYHAVTFTKTRLTSIKQVSFFSVLLEYFHNLLW